MTRLLFFAWIGAAGRVGLPMGEGWRRLEREVVERGDHRHPE